MDVEETIHIVEIEGAGEAFYDSPSLQPDSITVDDFDSNSGGGGGNDDLGVDDDGQGDGDEGPGDGGGGGGVLRTAEPLDEELQPRSKKLKKNQSAFMIFCNTHREDGHINSADDWEFDGCICTQKNASPTCTKAADGGSTSLERKVMTRCTSLLSI